MNYIENPKTKGSGIKCVIPQKGECPVKCPDCFFQSGRSFLEPLKDNLPNMIALDESEGYVIRVNDGNDSNVQREIVVATTEQYKHKFYNTSIPKDLESFNEPVVLTVNPGKNTDTEYCLLDPIPDSLMFVRYRVNMWNLGNMDYVIEHYTEADIPVVLTFMAYYSEDALGDFRDGDYTFRKRTLNSYWVATQKAWDFALQYHYENPLVYTCGKDANTFACSRCGNCLREYYATRERMNNDE